jgi:acetyl-CoA acyltransferase
LKQTGVKQDELDWIELNEAFAAQALAVMRDLGINPAKVNPLGSAIALGHPLGATGAIRTATLLHGMQRTGSSKPGRGPCGGPGFQLMKTAAPSPGASALATKFLRNVASSNKPTWATA